MCKYILASFPTITLDLVNLRQTIDGGALLLHAPALLATVGAILHNFRDRPNPSGLAHVEAAHGLLVGGELVGVEDSAGADEAGVAVLVEPLGADLLALAALDALGGTPGLLDGLDLLGLPGLVVGGGGEAEGLPDGGDLGRAEVGLADEGEVDGDSREAGQAADLVGLLLGAVQAVAEAVLVQAVLEADLGDDLLAVPDVLEADASVLEEAEVLHLHGGADPAGGLGGDVLLAELADGRSVHRVGRGATGGEDDGGGRALHLCCFIIIAYATLMDGNKKNTERYRTERREQGATANGEANRRTRKQKATHTKSTPALAMTCCGGKVTTLHY